MALVQEHALRDELFHRDLYAVSLVRPMGIGSLGMLSGPHSRVGRYLMEAFREGFIDFSELPKSVQDLVPSPPKAAPAANKGRQGEARRLDGNSITHAY